MPGNPTKPQMARVRELDRRIRAGKYPNCTQFAQEYGVSRKTIQRDITYLQDVLRAPIEYDHHKKGYYYSDPMWSFSPLNLTQSELLQLMLARQMTTQLEGTPLANTINSLLNKLTETADRPLAVDPLFLRQQVSFHNAPARPIRESIWTAVLEGLRRDHAVKIEYQPLESLEPACRVVEPVHLACVEGDWYFIAYDRTRRATRHFALSRTISAEVTGDCCGFRSFDPDEYFSNRFGRYIGDKGRSEMVELRFSREVGHAVRERTWHPRQRVKTKRDGSVQLSFPSPERLVVLRWVLQWGEYVKVIRPKGLAQAVQRTARNMLEVYQA